MILEDFSNHNDFMILSKFPHPAPGQQWSPTGPASNVTAAMLCSAGPCSSAGDSQAFWREAHKT